MNKAEPSMLSRSSRGLGAVLLGLWLLVCPCCATFTGVVTGPFTGLVDMPAEVYLAHRDGMDRRPFYWLPVIVVFAPAGAVLGPVAGLVKGVALDAQELFDRVSYSDVFRTGGDLGSESIWRPWKLTW
jgi:hypothetical protein